MNISSHRDGGVLIISIQGRLDAYGALELNESLESLITPNDTVVIFNMGPVSYLSSGGIRSLLGAERTLKEKGGCIHLCNLKSYPLDVLKMAGFDQIFSIKPTVEDALQSGSTVSDLERVNWIKVPPYVNETISLTILESSASDSKLNVVGDISKVLKATLGEEDIYSRKFSNTEYSIGLGGLGEKMKDFLEIMGEMITIGGTMVWLPTDGHDTPDFLIPATDTGMVTIHTGFNVALGGNFNNVLFAESQHDEGFTMDELYASLFALAREREPNFKGIISVAMQADVEEFYRSGIKIAPIKKFTPKNHEMIMHPDNIKLWMNIGTDPMFKGETMISFGVGVDLTTDLSGFDEEVLGALFYMHPANTVNKQMLLHNHAVVFKHVPLEKKGDLDGGIKSIVQNGEFLDMSHILDNSKMKRALLGVSYISSIVFEKNQEITLRGDCEGWNDTYHEITSKMFPDSTEIQLTPITGGYSGSAVFKVDAWDRSGRKEMPFVMKLGPWFELGSELKGYEEHVKRYIQNNATHVIDHCKIDACGGLLYNFAGINGRESTIKTMEDYYASHDTGEVLNALDKLFRNVLRSWYGQPKLKELYLYEEYDSFFQYDMIKNFTLDKFDLTSSEKYVKLPYNLGTSVNPLYFVENVMPERRSQAVSSYEASTHGDLNLRNVLLDDDLNIWLIDFAATHYSHILRDVAKLETAFKLECVDINSPEKLRYMLKLEERFLNARNLSDIPHLPLDSPDTQLNFDNRDIIKAFQCIRRVRKYGNMITLLDEDISQYLLGLLSYHLSSISFRSLNDYEREYAWISASLICNRLM
ncbi:anti-sigma factor antagonist [Methanobacterium sp. BAmetb5]|uniref:anti-sigma factor antagonist n=1 Tax=Methanobacterium sp. BAmetb5 TaxID=2025351 RepID=UPI000E9AB326|nr:anti-sigma factor antagonist [Methanobacterium sp. BAmetb5]AXV39836.1 MAG: anti-anti-sigma factor [Methanobacterium sp. BAmetb5]